MKRLNQLLTMLSMALVGIAVYQELSRPPEQRTWNGKVVDCVPYDFRFPTLERARARLWNPDDPRVLTTTIFGVGWTVNFAALAKAMGCEETVRR